MAKDLSQNLASRGGKALGRVAVVALRIEAFGLHGLAKLGLPPLGVKTVMLAVRGLILFSLLVGGLHAAAACLIAAIALTVVYIVVGGVDTLPTSSTSFSSNFPSSAFEPIEDSPSFEVSGVSRNGHDGYGIYDQFNNRIDNRY